MKGTDFPEKNINLGPPKGMTEEECYTLPAYYSKEHGAYVSCWVPSAEEIQEIQRTGKVWLWVFGQGHPPVTIEAFSPFEQRPEDLTIKGLDALGVDPPKEGDDQQGQTGTDTDGGER